jgi:hypothetical protein
MKLCLVPIDDNSTKKLLDAGCIFWLFSYLYIQKIKLIPEVIAKKKFLILDSGAHTYQKEGNKIDYDSYCEMYSEFVKRNSWIDAYVEFDIENKVGLKKVEEWRDRMIKITGKPPIVVWHRERGLDYYKYMVKEYPYVGFSGFVKVAGKPEVPEVYIPWFIETAHKNGSKIHGFGFTKELFKYRGFDSADSTSWIRGSMYGRLVKGLTITGSPQTIHYSEIVKGKCILRHNLQTSANLWVKLQKTLFELEEKDGNMG